MTATPDARRSPRPRRELLTSEAVVEASARVLARDGYAGLTMRAIADDLGVRAPALYWYFGDKRALELALYVHLMEGFTFHLTSDGWKGQLRQGAGQLRTFLRGVRDVTRLNPQGLWLGENALRQLDVALGVLRGAGLPPRDAAYAVNMLFSFVFQWSAAEAGFSAERAEFQASAARSPPDPALYPNVSDALPHLQRWDPDGVFAFRMDAMIDGLDIRATTGGRTA